MVLRNIATSVVSFMLTISFTHSIFASEQYEHLTLDDAVNIAIENNLKQKISLKAAAIAESQYQEALSARWPTVNLEMSAMRTDEDLTFDYPATSVPLGNLGATLGAALGPFLPPGASIPSTINVPKQRIKLMDRDTATATLKFMVPLYTGGKISSIIDQAEIGKEIAQKAYQRTQLQVVRDVKRYYYAVMLTQTLAKISNDTVDTLEVTRDLTKSIYEKGGSLNKLDYLKTEMALNYVKSLHAGFIAKEESAKAALVHVLGVPWHAKVSVSQDEFPESENSLALDQLITQAQSFNPDMEMIKLAVQVADKKVHEAKSAYYPQVALTANVRHIENSFEDGLVNSDNKNSWTIGVVMKMPLLDFGKTRQHVNTARLQHNKMQETKVLVEQGLSAQIKHLLINLGAANKQSKIAAVSKGYSEDYERLTSQAYQIGASKPEDMIQASIYHAIIQGTLLRAQHDRAYSMAEIEYFIGDQLVK